ncbi:MAG TPA: hypothetical protein VFJ94_02510 [Intrasporangium sp.]|uniref:hypothetical protein n=1 Tax=Intrasporangium sp. TaxID=1925024 RepID=UPI002D786EEA|nr:hypothetical protein [Intrasporangium sp.]HET7397370.1 hypothetical protein [Intrasporangium sp.]
MSIAVVGALAVTPAGASSAPGAPSATALSRISSPALQAYLMAHPERASERQRAHVEAARAVRSAASSIRSSAGPQAAARGSLAPFNRDQTGLPQNEESVSTCPGPSKVVLGGTNDYRGLLNPAGNFTGWHFSADDGRTVTNEGLLPTVQTGGKQVPSGGDPIVFATADCELYAASLSFPVDVDFTNLPANTNGATVYRSSPQRLASCPGGDAASCWPTRRFVATNRAGHFIDKPWMYVGHSGSAGQVVWVTYSDFDLTAKNPAGFTASIYAVRCDGLLSRCTAPIKISDGDPDVQFSDVTVGPDGRTYITWAQIRGELFNQPQTFIFKSRVAPAGSTAFGPTHVIHREPLAIPFGGLLHANDFRIASYPKNTVSMVNGRPRLWVVWDACGTRPLDTVCENAQVKLTWSDDLGASWSPVRVVSLSDENYFPTIDTAPRTGKVAIAYYTNRFDPVFHNRQDVELVTVSNSGAVTARTRLTPSSDETEADPLLGGLFIGDYFELDARDGTAYVHFNANHVSKTLLGLGSPIPQQDNFLIRRPL